jgi:hypothetical protein
MVREKLSFSVEMIIFSFLFFFFSEFKLDSNQARRAPNDAIVPAKPLSIEKNGVLKINIRRQ